MDGFICMHCRAWLPHDSIACPVCRIGVIAEGSDKNIIDHIQPNCLVYRYDGSDMLEPAVIIKEGKMNVKVATRLVEYAKPVTLPKNRVFSFNHHLLSSIQSLRNERTAAILRYDQMIHSHWRNLKPYYH